MACAPVAAVLASVTACAAPVTAPPFPPSPAAVATLRPVSFATIPGWRADDQRSAWEAFLKSCAALGSQPAWGEVCTEASALAPAEAGAVRRFFESRFTPYQVVNPGGSEHGLVTGYFEPLLRGSRTASGPYRYPLYGVPDDLLVVDLSDMAHGSAMNTTGQAGRPFTPHYGDMIQSWADVQYHPMWMDEADISAHAEGILVLAPPAGPQ